MVNGCSSGGHMIDDCGHDGHGHVVEPLLVIGPVDAHDDCLIMALEP